MAQLNGFNKDSRKDEQTTVLEGHFDWRGRPPRKDKHGGMRAALFTFVAGGFENMAFLANGSNLVTYFQSYMYYNLAQSANNLTNYMGTSFLLALLGGFIADSYSSKFKINVIFASIELLGYTLLGIQAHYPYLRPPFCNRHDMNSNCESVSGARAAMLFVGLYLIALGTGGIKAALPSYGADQFDDKDPKERKLISNFFNWFLFSLCVGSVFAVTFVVWIQNNKGWDVGFGICAGAVFIAILSLTLGLSTYRNRIPGGSPLTRIAQVFVAAFRNRDLPLPKNEEELYEARHDKEAGLQREFLAHTNQFRFLDKAAMVRDSEISERREEENPWHVCSVTQVEEVKILLRMMPVFGSTIVMNSCLAQLQTFSVQQGVTMDTHLGHLDIPPASLPVIPLVFMVILIPLYDQIFVPFARRLTGHESGITHLQRVGVGLVLSATAMAIAAVVEVKRKNVARHYGMVDAVPVLQPLPISVFWVGFQFFVFGIADMFTFVGLMEFFYSQAPSGMRSLSTAFSWCSLALGYFLSSLLVDIINAATRNADGSGGWLHGNNLNRNHLNLFYWMLSTLSILNFFNYLFWANWYTYKTVSSSCSQRST